LSIWGTRKARETITAIGTANKTQKNHIMLPHNRMQTNTSNGLTPRVFHIITGTKNFSSDCCIIVYRITMAKTPRRHVNIRAETAAGVAHKNGPRYGIISNNHASKASVHFCGIENPIRSNIRNPR